MEILTLEKLIQLSPVLVVFKAGDKMTGGYDEGSFCYRYGDLWLAKYGFFIRFHPTYLLFKIFDWFQKTPCIEINNDLSYPEKVNTLLHEIGHALCYKKNCECYWKNRRYREIHAYEYVLNCILRYRLKKEILSEILWQILQASKRDSHYGEAARYVMKTELWQNCNKHWKRTKVQNKLQ